MGNLFTQRHGDHMEDWHEEQSGESDEYEEVYEGEPSPKPVIGPQWSATSNIQIGKEEFVGIQLTDLMGKHTEMKLVLYRTRLWLGFGAYWEERGDSLLSSVSQPAMRDNVNQASQERRWW